MSHQLINTVLGTGNFGEVQMLKTLEGNPQDFLDTFKKHGFKDLDTARAYGTSERVLGQLKAAEQGFTIDTKFVSFTAGAHSAASLKESVKTSLQELNVKQVHILYLHSPDRATPFEESLKAVDEIYKEGSFQKFGLSNYTAEQVEEIVKICKEKNYVLPSVYQGNYNAITRKNEESLFPLLRKEKIAFYAYSPAAGGFFVQKPQEKPAPGSRFDPNYFIGQMYGGLYNKPSYFKALETLTAATEKHKLNNIEAALRWVYFHSLLKREHGDAIIIGASKLSQLESNLAYIEKGPLPAEVATVFEEIWTDIKADAPAYHN
jgi:aflatoxin B1 aldehyde reductase